MYLTSPGCFWPVFKWQQEPPDVVLSVMFIMVLWCRLCPFCPGAAGDPLVSPVLHPEPRHPSWSPTHRVWILESKTISICLFIFDLWFCFCFCPWGKKGGGYKKSLRVRDKEQERCGAASPTGAEELWAGKKRDAKQNKGWVEVKMELKQKKTRLLKKLKVQSCRTERGEET